MFSFNELTLGKVALEKLNQAGLKIKPNFYLYIADIVDNLGTVKMTGAEFEPNKSKIGFKLIPNTKITVHVTRVDVEAYENKMGRPETTTN